MTAISWIEHHPLSLIHHPSFAQPGAAGPHQPRPAGGGWATSTPCHGLHLIALQCRTMQRIQQRRLANGLWLITEQIPHVRSLALTWLLPAGVVHEPAEQQGVASVLSDMICRGAGDLDARAHSDALEMLGIQRDTQVMTRHLRISAALIGEKINEALPLLVDMVLRPRLEKSALAPSVDLALQTLDALNDEPQDRVFVELRKRHYAPPLDRSILGVREHLQALTLKQVRDFWKRTFVPGGSILALAGDLQHEPMGEWVEQLLAGWQGACAEPSVKGKALRGRHHETVDSAQWHLGLAYDTVSETDAQNTAARLAVNVLSGGASSRLFTEVREKRGLCYSVGARYGGDRDSGGVFCYVGTTPSKAQETLDVLVRELHRLSEGIEADEFRRALVGMKSSLVMQGESTSARALALASDQYIHGRPRSLEEVAALVDAVTLEKLNAFVKANPPGKLTVVSIGPGV